MGKFRVCPALTWNKLQQPCSHVDRPAKTETCLAYPKARQSAILNYKLFAKEMNLLAFACLACDASMFINRKPGLRFESVKWKEDAELLVLLPGEKKTSIYARSPFLATWVLPS
jgi:hypothetical protein